MRINNFEVKEFVGFLVSLKLSGKESRMRTRFCRLLGEHIKQYEDERSLLIEQYAEKDSDGKPVIVDDGGREVYKITDSEAFNREFGILHREEFIIAHSEDRIEMLKAIKDIVLNVDMEFDGENAFIYDRWCEIVEEVI
jgi:hypothetical protein